MYSRTVDQCRAEEHAADRAERDRERCGGQNPEMAIESPGQTDVGHGEIHGDGFGLGRFEKENDEISCHITIYAHVVIS